MKTLLLDCPPVCDFALLGLVSSEREYRLAWALNQALGWRLVRQAEHTSTSDRPSTAPSTTLNTALSVVQFRYPTPQGAIRLLANRAGGIAGRARPFLMPELGSFDFLLVLEGALAEIFDPAAWVARLRGVPLVQYVCPFDPSQLRGWEALLSP